MSQAALTLTTKINYFQRNQFSLNSTDPYVLVHIAYSKEDLQLYIHRHTHTPQKYSVPGLKAYAIYLNF
jgi:hypothetical protein